MSARSIGSFEINMRPTGYASVQGLLGAKRKPHRMHRLVMSSAASGVRNAAYLSEIDPYMRQGDALVMQRCTVSPL